MCANLKAKLQEMEDGVKKIIEEMNRGASSMSGLRTKIYEIKELKGMAEDFSPFGRKDGMGFRHVLKDFAILDQRIAAAKDAAGPYYKNKEDVLKKLRGVKTAKEDLEKWLGISRTPRTPQEQE